MRNKKNLHLVLHMYSTAPGQINSGFVGIGVSLACSMPWFRARQLLTWQKRKTQMSQLEAQGRCKKSLSRIKTSVVAANPFSDLACLRQDASSYSGPPILCTASVPIKVLVYV